MVDLLPGFQDVGVVNRKGTQRHIGGRFLPNERPRGQPGFRDTLVERNLRSEADDALPGPMQIFLADGTLVSDSCWETYRLSKWQQVSDTAISWDEDGMTINADIASLSDSELVLNLKLGSETQEQRFVSATVPYVCPDMVK